MPLRFKVDPGSGHVHLSVMVNNQGPFTFTLDTGASTTTVSKTLANKLGLETYEGRIKKAGGAGGNLVPVEAAKLESVAIGDEIFYDEEVGVIDFEKLLGSRGCATDGVIGYTMLKDHLLTLDYSTSTMSFTKENESSNQSINWTPFRYVEDSHLVLVPVFVNGTGPIDLILDTGSSGNIITPSVAEKLGIAQEISKPTPISGGCSDGECQGVGGKVRGYGVHVQQLTVAGATQSDILVAIIDLKIISPQGKKIDYGIIGYPFLKDYRLMIDYPNQQFALLDSSLYE
jgi:predicted aspartyl protease